SRMRRSLLAGIARDVPVGRRDLVEDHPHRLARQLAHFRDRVGHAPGDLVLSLLAVPFVDRDVHERHATPPSAVTRKIALPYHARQRRHNTRRATQRATAASRTAGAIGLQANHWPKPRTASGAPCRLTVPLASAARSGMRPSQTR